MDYPSDWEEMALSEFSEINPHTEIPDEFYYVDLESVKDVFLLQTRKEKKFSAPSRAKRYATKGDIFFQTVRPYQRNNYIFKLQGDYVFSTGYAQLRTKNNPDFLFYLIRQDKFVHDVLDNCTGTSYPAINPMNLAKIHIHVPPLAEQKAIADTLETFDAHIKNLSELIEKKKAIRDGALEDLMSGKIRLKGFSGDWEVKKLGELCKIFDGTHQTPKYTSRGIKFVSVENIYDLYQSEKYISHDAYISDFKVYPSKGDILMTRIGDIGTPCIVSKDEALAFYVSLALFKSIKINNEYLCHYIKSSAFQKELYDRTLHHATPKKINKGEIDKCLVKYPPIAEQQAIAETLTAFDDEIKALEAEREKIIQIRDGAMNDLLTGKIRLKF